MTETKRHNPFNDTAVAYEQWFADFANIRETEIRAVKHFFDPEKKSVEIGAGTGLFSSALGVKLGIEPAEAMAKMAREKGIEIIKGYAEDIPLPDRSHEQVLMITVDCFLNDVAKAFSEIHRILTDNGVFILAFLDRATALGQVYEDTKDMDDNYRYATFHSAAEIEAYLDAAGFTISDSIQTIFSFDNVEQEIRPGTGEGVFAILKVVKKN